MSNVIILMGAPGSGKTAIARELAARTYQGDPWMIAPSLGPPYSIRVGVNTLDSVLAMPAPARREALRNAAEDYSYITSEYLGSRHRNFVIDGSPWCQVVNQAVLSAYPNVPEFTREHFDVLRCTSEFIAELSVHNTLVVHVSGSPDWITGKLQADGAAAHKKLVDATDLLYSMVSSPKMSLPFDEEAEEEAEGVLTPSGRAERILHVFDLFN